MRLPIPLSRLIVALDARLRHRSGYTGSISSIFPPVSSMRSPVIHEAAGEQRKMAAEATSSTVPSRFSRLRATRTSRLSFFSSQ
jgi:nickel-dependent lactate racemase